MSDKGLIFLPTHNMILKEMLTNMTEKDAKKEPVDIKLADFDGVEYHVSVLADNLSECSVSIAMRCLKDILPMGAKAAADEIYPKMVANDAEDNYDLTLTFNLDDLPMKREELIQKVSELRTSLMGAPFKRCFDSLVAGSSKNLKPMTIPFREDELIQLVPSEDRVMAFFSVIFEDETDRAIAYIFLQEFAEANRRVNGAPNVVFSKDPPKEIQNAKGFKENSDESAGYIGFQIFKTHVEGKKLANTVNLLVSFRAYLHYHIKASKARLHTSMRTRVALLLKALNRANPKTESAESAVGRRNTVLGKKKF